MLAINPVNLGAHLGKGCSRRLAVSYLTSISDSYKIQSLSTLSRLPAGCFTGSTRYDQEIHENIHKAIYVSIFANASALSAFVSSLTALPFSLVRCYRLQFLAANHS